MKIALACLEIEPQNLSKNLDSAVASLVMAQKHRVDLVIFGERFLGETAISLDSQALFRLKIACTYYDLSIGIGFLQEKDGEYINNYVVINNQGEILLDYQSKQEMEINEIKLRIVLGGDGFDMVETEGILVWPILNYSTPKEWFNYELSKYRTQANKVAKESILVNSIIKEKAYGGGFHLKNNSFEVNQPMEQKGLSIIEI